MDLEWVDLSIWRLCIDFRESYVAIVHENGKNALHLAREKGHKEVVEFCVEFLLVTNFLSVKNQSITLTVRKPDSRYWTWFIWFRLDWSIFIREYKLNNDSVLVLN